MNQARTRKSSEDEKTLPSAALPGSDNRPVTWSSDLLSASRPVRSFIILVLYGALFTLFHHIAALWATEQFFSIWFPGAGLRFAFLWISGPRWSPFAAASEVLLQLLLGETAPDPSFATFLGMLAPCLMYGVAIEIVRKVFARRRNSFFVVEHEAIVLAAVAGAALACLTALPLLIYEGAATGALDFRKIVVSLFVFSVGDLLGVLTIAIPIFWARRRESAHLREQGEKFRSKTIELLFVYIASWIMVGAIYWVGMGFTLAPILLAACWMSFRAGRLVAWTTFIVTTLLTLPISATLTSDIDRLRAHLLLASIAMIGYLIASFAEAEALARKEVQRRDRLLYQADRLKTLRAMSVAVIHEISQPLSTIALEAQGLAGEVRSDRGSTSDLRDPVELISRKASELSSLVMTLRQFGSRTDGSFERIQARDLVLSVLAIAQPEAKIKMVTLRPEFENLFTIVGNRVELQQTFLNLVRNAISASPKYGEIQLRTVRRANRVEFEVLNLDGGLSGQGMGIGLIISRAIAESHGGSIRENFIEGRRSFSLILEETESDGE